MSDAKIPYHLMINCDLRGYSKADDQRQRRAQELLDASLTRAASCVGLDRGTWTTQLSGDGLFAVLPATTPEALVVDGFTRRLNAELASVNSDRVPEAQLQLRLAMHQGTAVEGALGFPGRDPVELGRLLDSAPARQALEACPEAALVLILSDHLYSSVVASGHTSLRAGQFRKVPVRVKTFDGCAWLWVPDADVHTAPLREPQHRTQPEITQRAEVINTFTGANNLSHANFGPNYGVDKG